MNWSEAGTALVAPALSVGVADAAALDGAFVAAGLSLDAVALGTLAALDWAALEAEPLEPLEPHALSATDAATTAIVPALRAPRVRPSTRRA